MSVSIHPVIPEDERFCIWMDAGIVDYKLCSDNFACERCPLDAQMRASHAVVQAPKGMTRHADDSPHGVMAAAPSSQTADEMCASTLDSLVRSIVAHAIPSDRKYAPCHTWVRNEEDGSVTLGVDHFMGSLLTGMHAVACSVPATHINDSDPFAWIVADGETLAVRSPLSGTIVDYNAALAERSPVIHHDPYGSGWIARIMPDGGLPARSLYDSGEMRSMVKNDCERYRRSINGELRRMQADLEGTMFDGGTPLDHFEDILGARLHYRILERFLRP